MRGKGAQSAKDFHDSRRRVAEGGNGAEPRKTRADEHLVSQKHLLVNHLGVYLVEAPVLGVAKRLGRDLDRRRVKLVKLRKAQPMERGPKVERNLVASVWNASS